MAEKRYYHFSHPIDNLNMDSEVSDTVLDDDADLDDLLEYLLQKIPLKKRKTAKGVVDLYKRGKG